MDQQTYAVAIVFKKQESVQKINLALRLTYVEARSDDEALGLALKAIETAQPDFVNNDWSIHLRSAIEIKKPKSKYTL